MRRQLQSIVLYIRSYAFDMLNTSPRDSIGGIGAVIDIPNDKYPYCIVWTPIPILTWLFPFIGHMGIALSNGVIRDFAGPYFVSEDSMAFGRPTRYLQLQASKTLHGSPSEWDECITKASNVYNTRMHNLLCDNCHSHVGMALNLMNYNGSTRWNMVRLAAWMFFCGSYVSIGRAVKTWLPFIVLLGICVLIGSNFSIFEK